jgi:hypothetical protein
MASLTVTEYSRLRRQKYRLFNCEIDYEAMEKLNKYLEERNLTKKKWFNMVLAETFKDVE